MTLLAGAAEVVITPPIGTYLDGYGARASGSVGVHDDLHARALVADDGTTQVALVSCDLIGVDRRLVGERRARGAEQPAHALIEAQRPLLVERDLVEQAR